MIVIIGDSCIDKFTYGDCNRICPEAPVPVFTPIKGKSNLGMAGNVYNNLEALGKETYILTNENKPIKTRLIDRKTNQMLVRIDEDDRCNRITEREMEEFRTLMHLKTSTKAYKTTLIEIEAVIISDYDKGFLTEDDIIEICKMYECPIFLDTKKQLGEWCDGVDYIKINNDEYAKTKYTAITLDIEDKLIVTRGEDGCSFKGKDYLTNKCEVKDLSGAGDTFLAGLVSKYTDGSSIEEALDFANEVATKVVQKKGVAVI
jgi:D-beta-D-heptose 7-phosphate kinase/D-beta-D-heptose 1-phosphate adenosyltransferase